LGAPGLGPRFPDHVAQQGGAFEVQLRRRIPLLSVKDSLRTFWIGQLGGVILYAVHALPLDSRAGAMAEASQEWFRQAEYDFETARAMQAAGRRFYAVFFCHLSLEKALKGLYAAKFGQLPPRTHDLLFLVERIGLELPEDRFDFVAALNTTSVRTRYPEDLAAMQAEFPEPRPRDILDQTEGTLRWLRTQLDKP